jgi:4-amino-4-deoxy-L-arabinose transferase-like glycosyltransferase
MSDTKSTARFASGPVWSIAGAVAVAQLIAAVAGSGYWFDEVYMVAIGSHHLDWGSADQPPLAPALAGAINFLVPGSIVALRVPAIIATAAAVVVAALIAREMGCDRRAQVFVAAAQATALWIAVGGHWLTPYALEPLQWLLIFWLLTRWLRLRDDRLLILLGVAIGIAAMTKFQVLLLCAVLLCAVAVCGPRDLLRRRSFWLGVLIAAVIAAPTLMWQAANGWPQLRMAPIVAEESGPLYGGRPGIAVTLILFAGIATTALMGYGTWLLLRSAELRRYRFLAVTVLALYVVFVATAGRPYYLGGGYAVLAAAGALGLQRRREAGGTRWRWAVWPVYAASAVLAVVSVVIGAVATRSDVPERIAQHTAETYHALPAAQRERTAVVGESYIVAAYVDGYAERYDLPRAFSTTRSYGYFDPPREQQDSILFVGSDPARWRPYFADARKVGNVQGDLDAWLLTGRNEPWAVLWPQLRTLRVA